jgi:predicted glycosyltransferase
VRIWIDMTAPAHPIVFRPIIDRLRAAGHDVDVTARDYAQNLALLERLGIPHTTVGPGHGGASMARKAAALASRTAQMVAWGRGKGFDLAVAHGSNDLPLAAAALRIPEVNTFDYEWATKQHQIGCRIARIVMTPDTIPPQRLRRYGVTPRKLRQYPGLKEEYYLADFEPDGQVPARLGVDPARVLLVLRPPPDVALYHRLENPLFGRILDHVGRRDDVHVVVVPRTTEQRDAAKALGFPSVIVPDGAVDAQSLIALADLVVSAGGTMNREAVALGTPVYTTFSGRLGGVDEALMREGRLRRLTDPQALALVKRDPAARAVHRRDPQLLADTILEAAR